MIYANWVSSIYRQARPAAPGDTAVGLSGATFCYEKKISFQQNFDLSSF